LWIRRIIVKRIVVNEHGGPEKLTLVDGPTPEPGPTEALVAISVSGVNFIDVYYRTGLYPSERPTAIGSEAAGVVERVGSEVTDVKPGDRVVYAMARGSYAEYAVVPAAQLAPVPDDVTLEHAAAAMLQGTTAHYLTRSTFVLDKTHTCLVHAAAGGLGTLLVQMAKERGARVIGTVSTDQKARTVRALGADDTILYTQEDFETAVKRLTNGRGVDVVYDSVGRTTFDKSLKVLRPRGTIALVGQSSGPVPPLDPGILNQRGSLFLTRPSLGHHLASRDELLERAGDVLGLVRSGKLRVQIWATYPLSDAARAHRDLESRATTGKLLLNVRD
jgi:NADPH2:quinone reductase